MDQVIVGSPPRSWLRARRLVGGLVVLIFGLLLLLKDRSWDSIFVTLHLALAGMFGVFFAEWSATAWARRATSRHGWSWLAVAAIDLLVVAGLAAYLVWRLWRLVAR